jgi:putative mRNA 3-end processing factor
MTRIYLKSDGAILLGDLVSADGFAFNKPVRVQTHIHSDHMVDFDTSKANQTIVMSPETRALLNALHNADLPYRNNLSTVRSGEKFRVEDEIVELYPSQHMLGSVQVKVTCKDGYAVGYSSDFFWPIETVMQVDELIVDATYGDPLRTRRFSQQLADDCLEQAATVSIVKGLSTACVGHVGRLHYALHLLGSLIPWPIICSPRTFALVSTYHQNGYPMPPVLRSDAPEAIEHLRARTPVFAFVTLHEQRHLPWLTRMRKITLSAHIASPEHPVTSYDNGDCCISLTDHADFPGTLNYIQQSGAKIVYTDPRSGNAAALAEAVRTQLGLSASIVPELRSLEWG